jgi:ubiquinone/menaquinone biosynthesis methyltransferase
VPEKPRAFKLNDVNFRNPAQKRGSNRVLFHTVAPAYDRVTPWLSWGRDAAWKKLLVQSLPALRRPAILDLACGTGDIALALAGRYPQARVTGLDLSGAMLALAQERCREAHIAFRQGDMSKTGFPGGQFDLITGGYALRNAPDLKGALAEIHRLLKKGGRGAFLDFSKSPHPWMQSVSLALLRVWGAWWGWVFHRNPDIYAYLAESLRHFPDRVALRRLLAEAGFKVTASRVLFFGFIELVVFEK